MGTPVQYTSRHVWGWIVSKVQSLFWRRVTSGGAFQLEDTTFCGGGVRFDLEEGSYFAGGEVTLLQNSDYTFDTICNVIDREYNQFLARSAKH